MTACHIEATCGIQHFIHVSRLKQCSGKMDTINECTQGTELGIKDVKDVGQYSLGIVHCGAWWL
jgi:hypothetical protein